MPAPTEARSPAHAVRCTWLVARRDLASSFSSMSAFGIAAAFLAVSGLFFGSSLVNGREASLRLFVQPFDLLVLLLTPLITSRSFAEERRTGSAELLFTLPVSPAAVVVGKYLSALVLLAAILVATLLFPVLLAVFGRPDWGPIATQYLGALLLSGSLAAVGVTVSLVSPSQALVAVVSLFTALVLWFVGPLSDSLSGPARSLLSIVSPRAHLASLNRGILDIADVSFFVAFAAVWLAAGAQLARSETFRR